jgi:Electron transfer DM13
MKKWTKLLIPVAAVLALVAWYVFRPERLVVNRRVDEAMPTGQGGLLSQPLESGRFYSILHPTEGTATIFQMGEGTRILRLTSFRTSNGPDVHVYMVAPPTQRTSRQCNRPVSLILESSKETSATKITRLVTTWT